MTYMELTALQLNPNPRKLTERPLLKNVFKRSCAPTTRSPTLQILQWLRRRLPACIPPTSTQRFLVRRPLPPRRLRLRLLMPPLLPLLLLQTVSLWPT
jgi:hypothetical protein